MTAPLPGRRCETMAEVRRAIDALDDAIVPLLVARCRHMTDAARIKRTPDAVRDEPRIEEIVQRVRAHSERLGGHADLVETIYRALMEASIAHEAREFRRLHQGAAS